MGSSYLAVNSSKLSSECASDSRRQEVEKEAVLVTGWYLGDATARKRRDWVVKSLARAMRAMAAEDIGSGEADFRERWMCFDWRYFFRNRGAFVRSRTGWKLSGKPWRSLSLNGNVTCGKRSSFGRNVSLPPSTFTTMISCMSTRLR